jgi:hypothetical protein
MPTCHITNLGVDVGACGGDLLVGSPANPWAIRHITDLGVDVGQLVARGLSKKESSDRID